MSSIKGPNLLHQKTRWRNEREALRCRIFTFDKSIARQTAQAFPVGSPLYNLVTDPDSILGDYLGVSDNWYAQEYNGTRYKYTEQEMLGYWDMILIHKNKNQIQQDKINTTTI